MIFSVEQTFSDRQVVSTSNTRSTNIIDLGTTGQVVNSPAVLVREVGDGARVQIAIQLLAAAADPADTLQVEILADNDRAFGSPRVAGKSGILTGGDAGARLVTAIPQNMAERYVGLNYVVTGSAPSYTIRAGIPFGLESADTP